ncbi:cuticle protein 7-like [Daphnia carinata]|uniref:cuticle protein 7-like n=1 Tax=Daphnia carinata TaxID=120202 RepID=UPI00257FD87C|nr:cuticle protein 7-like [Daphnia carinata]
MKRMVLRSVPHQIPYAQLASSTKMKFVICVVLVFAAAKAVPNPTYVQYGAVPVGFQSQYHAQNELGQYAFGHQDPNQVRSETKDAFGIVRGSYSYANPDGSIVTNNYVADENGFRSSLAPSNGPLLPLVGKAPKLPISHVPIAVAAAPVPVATAPVHVVAPTASVKVEQPTVVQFAGGHVAPVATAPLGINPYGYAYAPYPYSSYHYAPHVSPYGPVVVRSW